MRNITIKICGPAATGKSTLQFIIIEKLRELGMNVEFVPDVDFLTEHDLVKTMEPRFIENDLDFSNFNVRVETIQTNRSLPIVD